MFASNLRLNLVPAQKKVHMYNIENMELVMVRTSQNPPSLS